MSKLYFLIQHANEATVQRNWYVVDGTNQTEGSMCAKIAAILLGKNKAYYTPHVDTDDYIIMLLVEAQAAAMIWFSRAGWPDE